MIRFRCVDCGKPCKAEESWVGRKAKCPHCGISMIIPWEAIFPAKIQVPQPQIVLSAPPQPEKSWLDAIADSIVSVVEAGYNWIAEDFRKAKKERLEQEARWAKILARHGEILEKSRRGEMTEKDHEDFEAIVSGFREIREEAQPRSRQTDRPRRYAMPAADYSPPPFSQHQTLADDAKRAGDQFRYEQNQRQIADQLAWAQHDAMVERMYNRLRKPT